MKKYVKDILYWSSLICPLADIFKGIIIGISSAIENAGNDWQELKKIEQEKLIAHKSELNRKQFEKDSEL